MSAEVKKLARRLNLQSDDTLVVDLWEEAKQDVLNYCNRKKVTKEMQPSVLKLAVVYFNRIGSEGESSRGEGGISRTFETGIPTDIKQSLAPFRVGKMRRF